MFLNLILIANVARYDIRTRLRRASLWIAAFMPFLLVVLSAMCVYFMPSEERHQKPRNLPAMAKHLVLIVVERESDPEMAKLAFSAVMNRDLADSGLPLLPEPEFVKSGEEGRAMLAEFHRWVLRDEIAGMIFIEPATGEGAVRRESKFVVYGRPGSKELIAMEARLRLEVAASKTLTKEDKQQLARNLKDAEARIEIAGPAPPAATTERYRREILVIISALMGVIFSVAVSLGMSPLFSSGHGLEKSIRSRLEVELTVMSKSVVVLGHMLGASTVSALLLAVYSITFLVPLAYFGLMPIHAIPMFFLLGVTGFLVHAPCCYLIGLTGSAAEPSSPFQSLYGMLLGLLVPICLFISGNPNGPIAEFLSYVPFSAPSIMMTRTLLTPEIEAWKVTASVLSMLVGTVLFAAITIRVFAAVVVSGNEQIGIRRFLRLLRNPKSA